MSASKRRTDEHQLLSIWDSLDQNGRRTATQSAHDAYEALKIKAPQRCAQLGISRDRVLQRFDQWAGLAAYPDFRFWTPSRKPSPSRSRGLRRTKTKRQGWGCCRRRSWPYVALSRETPMTLESSEASPNSLWGHSASGSVFDDSLPESSSGWRDLVVRRDSRRAGARPPRQAGAGNSSCAYPFSSTKYNCL